MERVDSAQAESIRMLATARLEAKLDEIVERFEQIVAARDLVMALTGEHLPGLEPSLVEAAAAPRSAPRAETTLPPAPPAPAPSAPSVPLDDTGL